MGATFRFSVTSATLDSARFSPTVTPATAALGSCVVPPGFRIESPSRSCATSFSLIPSRLPLTFPAAPSSMAGSAVPVLSDEMGILTCSPAAAT